MGTRLLVFVVLCGAFASTGRTASHPQIPIWNARSIEGACARALSNARAQVAVLEKLPLPQAAAGRVFRSWDRLQILLEDTQGPVEVLTNMSPDPATRAAGEACLLKINEFSTELLQNEGIYARFQRAAPADNIDRKLNQDVVEAFEDTGVALPPEKRARMKAILQRLVDKADGDIGRAQHGIVYIDEIDKLKAADNPRQGNSGESVQHALLKIMEGSQVKLGGAQYIDTTNILFICGGAFAGIEKIIESRIGHKGVGFGADIRRSEEKELGAILGRVLPEDLLKFGLIPEFVGRLPVIGAVSSLDKEALVRILVEPKNALVKQYRKFFEFDGVELEFADDALEAVAEQALLRGTGARGLRAILEEVLLNVMYDLPSRTDVGKCVIDRDVVLEKVNPTLVPRSDKPEQTRPRRAAS